MKINHNISAQLSSVNLKKTDNRVTTSLERLSSGYKINRAADDSAGMALSNKMRTQIRALDQSSRNASDGSSIIQTAEGALSEIENVLQRIRELSVQAANDTYTLDDRKSVQDEVDQLLDEIDRISSTTEFNGKSLLDGSASRSMTSSADNLTPLLSSMNVPAGKYTLSVDESGTPATAVVSYELPDEGSTYVININGADIVIGSSDTDESAQEKIIAACDAMNIEVSDSLELTTRAAGSAQQIAIKYPGDEEAEVTTGTDAIVSLSDGYPESAKYTVVGNNVKIVDNDGFEMQLEVGKEMTGDVTFGVYDAGSMKIQVGANEGQFLDMDFPTITCQTLALKDADGKDTINTCTQHGATLAIDAVDEAIRSVSAARSRLGAYENRLESTVSSLDVSSENMTSAMSRIMDTDMADEMTKYTQESVLSQAATSMLSQANSRPQQIMNLLQG